MTKLDRLSIAGLSALLLSTVPYVLWRHFQVLPAVTSFLFFLGIGLFLASSIHYLGRRVGWWLCIPNVVMLVGLLMNSIVIVANGGFMPVVPTEAVTAQHIIANGEVWSVAGEDTRLLFLADIHDGASLGDGVLAVGMLLLILYCLAGACLLVGGLVADWIRYGRGHA